MKQIQLFLLTLTLLCACREGGPGAAGEPCLTGGDCEDGTLCIGAPGEDSICLTSCGVDTVLCEMGELCITVAEGMRVCAPGGDTAVGATCEAQSDCVVGTSCIIDAAAVGTCRKVCTQDGAPSCSAVEKCTDLPNTPHGFCEVGQP